MSQFRNLAKEARNLRQFYTLQMDSPTGILKFTFRTLNGLEGAWIFRGNFHSESETSQNILLDHRSACASLVSIEDESGEVLSPVEIVEVLFTPEELSKVEELVEKFNDNDLEKLSNKILWESSRTAKTVDQFQALPLANREIIWQLLHIGFRTFFDLDFNLNLSFQWAKVYKDLKPNAAAVAIQDQLKKMRESLESVPADAEETPGS